jgi:hypothetical protein
MSRYAVAGVGVVVALLLTGCGPKPVKVSGTVTLNGQPVDGASVQFVPADGSGRQASGGTDKDGKFQLTTYENNDGAMPGEYKVVVKYTPPVETGASANTEVMKQVIAQQQKDAKKKPKYVIPAAWGASSTTPMTQKVPADGPVTIDIK